MGLDPLLKMHNICKEFPGVLALDDVHFELEVGEIHALLGENGAGKSTLIKVLTGAESLTSGTVELQSKELKIKSPLQAQNEGISTVYQEVNLCSNLSVAENIYIGREPRNRFGLIDWPEMKRKSIELLKDFDLNIDVEKTLDNFSVAVQQMVAIARSCDVSAKVLILDEPTSSLTEVEVKKLFKVMLRLKEEGMGIVFVTHFLDQVYKVCDRITVLRNGQFICTEKSSDLNHLQLVSKMIGKEYKELPSDMSSKDEKKIGGIDTFMNLNSVYKMGKVQTLDLNINKGEILGFAGLLGSGRSEIARVIFGADSVDRGSMSIGGRDVNLKTPLDGITSGIAFCPEDRKVEGIVGELTIRENIILALQTKRGMTKPISLGEAKKIADKYIKLLQIKTPSQDQQIKNLSGGNQQKVILGRWMATSPDLFILDEPTRGIDVGTKAEIQKIMIDLAAEGMSVIFISSEIDEMLRCCSRMVVLKDHSKVCELTGNDLHESSVMKSIAGGAK